MKTLYILLLCGMCLAETWTHVTDETSSVKPFRSTRYAFNALVTTNGTQGIANAVKPFTDARYAINSIVVTNDSGEYAMAVRLVDGGTSLTGALDDVYLNKSADTAGSLTVTNLNVARTIGYLEFSYWNGFGLLVRQLKIKNDQIGFYDGIGNLSTLQACEPTLSNHVATMHYVDNATNGLVSLGQVQAMTNGCLQVSNQVTVASNQGYFYSPDTTGTNGYFTTEIYPSVISNADGRIWYDYISLTNKLKEDGIY